MLAFPNLKRKTILLTLQLPYSGGNSKLSIERGKNQVLRSGQFAPSVKRTRRRGQLASFIAIAASHKW